MISTSERECPQCGKTCFRRDGKWWHPGICHANCAAALAELNEWEQEPPPAIAAPRGRWFLRQAAAGVACLAIAVGAAWESGHRHNWWELAIAVAAQLLGVWAILSFGVVAAHAYPKREESQP